MDRNDPVKSIIDDIQDRKEAKKNFFEKNEGQKEEYKTAINGIAGSKNGKYFLKVLINYIDLYGYKGSLEPRDMFVDKGKKSVYLEMIRPYLLESVRKEIE